MSEPPAKHSCADLQISFPGRAMSELPELAAHVDEVSCDAHEWRTLYRCRECGQEWVEEYEAGGHASVPSVRKSGAENDTPGPMRNRLEGLGDRFDGHDCEDWKVVLGDRVIPNVVHVSLGDTGAVPAPGFLFGTPGGGGGMADIRVIVVMVRADEEPVAVVSYVGPFAVDAVDRSGHRLVQRYDRVSQMGACPLVLNGEKLHQYFFMAISSAEEIG